jgi:hypothetical protein
MKLVIEADPEGFALDSIFVPPSLAPDSGYQSGLLAKLEAYKYQMMREREIEAILSPLKQQSQPRNRCESAATDESGCDLTSLETIQFPKKYSPNDGNTCTSRIKGFCGRKIDSDTKGVDISYRRASPVQCSAV